MDLWKSFTDFGLIGLIVGTLFFIVWRMLVWVMKWVDKREDSYNKERENWLTTLNKIQNCIERHDERAEERGKYVREEHKQMIETLGRINGYKDNNGSR